MKFKGNVCNKSAAYSLLDLNKCGSKYCATIVLEFLHAGHKSQTQLFNAQKVPEIA